MKLNEIRIGSVIEINITRNGSQYRTVSKVEYTDERFIGVTPIASSHGLFRFQEDDSVDLIYNEQEKYWKWSNVKAGIAKRKDGSRLHVFSTAVNGQHFNRRTQFRFEIGSEITMKYEVRSDMEEEVDTNLENIFLMMDKQYEEVECRGYLKDLSEGGALVESDVKLKEGTFVSFTLDSDIGKIYLRGVIVRAKVDKRGYFDNIYGLSFVETSKNYLQYFYREQRRQLYENKKD